MKATTLKSRYNLVVLTLADLRQDFKAQKLGLYTSFDSEETRRLINILEVKAGD